MANYIGDTKTFAAIKAEGLNIQRHHGGWTDPSPIGDNVPQDGDIFSLPGEKGLWRAWAPKERKPDPNEGYKFGPLPPRRGHTEPLRGFLGGHRD